MWPHKKSKKPKTHDGDSTADQKGRHHSSRLRGILGLSNKPKHTEPEVQTAQPAQNSITQSAGTVVTEIANQPKQDRPIPGHEELSVKKPILPATELPGSGGARDPINVGGLLPRDLWQEAASSLDKKQKITLGLLELSSEAGKSSTQSVVNAIEDVVQKTESSLAAYKNSGKIKRRDGKVLLDVRGSAERILRGTLRVKDIIDAGVKFDPTGYASTAWGIISLGLQLAQNDVDRMKDVFSASAFLTDVLRRYANIEANYRDQTVPDVEHLEDHIITVYKAVLEYSAKVRENHKLGVGSRILETFYSLDKPALKDLKSSVHEADSVMENWRQLIEHEYRIKEAASIEKRVNKILENYKDLSDQLNVLTTDAERREFNDILNWLQTISTASKHNASIAIRKPDTAEWIFTNDEYLSWLSEDQSSNRLLWLHGPYGCGKSVLFANMIKRLRQEEDSYTICAYWYFDSSISANNTNAALRSVIAQIVGALQIVPNALKKLKTENMVPNREPTTEDLLKVLLAAIKESRSRSDIIIAFDALDECPDRADFLEAIISVMEKASRVRILLTSRPEQDIQSGLAPIVTETVQVLHMAGDDVERFVVKELKDVAFSRYSKEVKDAIKDRLLGNDDKRFRLVALQIQELKDCWDTSLIYETLDEIPTSIEEAYQKALKKISEKPKKAEKIVAVFEWIFVAKRTLTLGEVGSALHVQFPERLLSDCPTCLVRMSDENYEREISSTQSWYKARTVEFDHSSVRDFIVSSKVKAATDPKVSRYFVDVERSNINAAIRCLDIILAQNDAKSLDLAVKEEPILEYAATYWVSHVRSTKSVPGSLGNPQLLEKVNQLFSEGDLICFLNWLRVYDPDKPNNTIDLLRPLEECAQPLYYAAMLGLEEVVETLLQCRAQTTSTKGSFEDPFVAAAVHGHVGCLKKMLEAGYAMKLWTLCHIMREVKNNEAEVIDVILGAYLTDPTVQAPTDMMTITTDQLVKAAVSNHRKATPVISLVSLAEHNLPIRITSAIVAAAKQNYQRGEDAMAFLLRRHQDQHLSISEDALVAIARDFNGDIMRLALNCISNDVPLSTFFIAEMGLAASQNKSYGEGVISALLDRVGDQFRVTKEMVDKSLTWRVNVGQLNIFVRTFGSEIPITHELVQAAARHCDREVMEILLNRGDDVLITTKVAVGAAKNDDHGLEVMRVLLEQRKGEFEVTSEVVAAAVMNSRSSLSLIKLLVNKAGTDKMEITEPVIDRVLSQGEDAAAVIKILLQESSPAVFEDDALRKLMKNSDIDVIRLVLDRERRGLISLSEKAIAAAVCNKKCGKEVLTSLLSQLREAFPVTEDLIAEIAEASDADIMKLLLDQHRSRVSITPCVVSGIGNNEDNGALVFQILLEYRGTDIDVNDELIQAAASSRYNGKAMTTRFLSHNGAATLEISTESVALVARKLDGETMTILLDRWAGNAQLDELVLLGAVQNANHGAELVDVLIRRYGQDIPLTLDVINTTVSYSTYGPQILSSFLDYDANLPLTEGTVEKVVKNYVVGSEIFSVLLQRRPHDFPVTTQILKAMLSNRWFGVEMMKMLLSKRRDDISITPEVLACAIENNADAVEKVALLLDLQESPRLLTAELLVAALRTWSPSTAVLAVLFDRHSLDYIPLTADVIAEAKDPEKLAALLRLLPRDLRITDSMVKAVIRNSRAKAQMISLLLDYRGRDITITKGIVETALELTSSEDVIRLLLCRRGEDFPVTKKIITQIARNYDEDTMTLLLEQQGKQVAITSDILDAAADNTYHGPEMLKVLLAWQPDIPVTEELMIVAANKSDDGPQLMRVILDKYGREAPVTDKVLQPIIMAFKSGEWTMDVLVERRGQDIVLTDIVVDTARWYRSWNGPTVLITLLRGLGRQTPAQITEEAVVALARYFGPEEMTLCLNARGKKVIIDLEMVDALAQNDAYGQNILKMLLNLPSSDFVINLDTIPVLVGHFDDETVSQLWDKQGAGLTMNEDIFMAAAEGGNYEVVHWLLKQPGNFQQMRISPRLIETIAATFDGEMMSLLLAQGGVEAKITEEILMSAIQHNSNSGAEVLSVLLDERADEIQLNEAILMEVAERYDKDITQRLYNLQGDKIPVTGGMIRAAAANETNGKEVAKVLLAKDMPINQDVVAEVAKNLDGEMMRFLLQQRGADVHITEEIIEATFENHSYCHEMILLFLEECADQIPATESFLIACIQQIPPEVVAILLDKRYGEVTLTEGVVMAALDVYYYLEMMTVLLNRRVEDIPLTTLITSTIARRLDATSMSLLLEKRAEDVDITEELIMETMKNYNYGNEIMHMLLEKRAEIIPLNEAIVEEIAAECEEDIFQVLLQKRGKDIVLTKELVMALSRHYYPYEQGMRALAMQVEDSCVNEDVLAAVVENFNAEILDILLHRHAKSIFVTEKVFVRAASNSEHGAELMARLVGISNIPISRKVVNAAAYNSSQAAGIMDVLLDKDDLAIPITPTLIQKAVEKSDGELLEVLLRHRRGEIAITPMLVESCSERAVMTLLCRRDHYSIVTGQAVAAIARRFDVEIMEALLDLHGADLSMTEDVIRAAGMNTKHGTQLISLLLHRLGTDLPVTDNSLRMIVRKSRIATEFMTVLLQYRKDFIITEELLWLAARSKWNGTTLLTTFFHHLRKKLPITERVVKTTARNIFSGLDRMTFLLEQFGKSLPITEKVIIGAVNNSLENQKVLDLLQDHCSIPVTARVLEVAARKGSEASKLITMLLNESGLYRQVTQGVVSTAIQNWGEVDSLLPILFRRSQLLGQIDTMQKMLRTAVADSYKATSTLLHLLPKELGISEAIMQEIIKLDHDDMQLTRLVLDRQEHYFPITAGMLKAAAQSSNGKAIIQLLFEKNRTTLHITEDMLMEIARSFDAELLTLLVNGQDIQTLITEPVMHAVLENERFRATILEALLKLHIKIPVTETLLQDVAKSTTNYEDVMNILLKNRPPELSITESIMEAVVTNEKQGQGILQLIFNTCSETIRVNESVMLKALRNKGCAKELLTLLFDHYGPGFRVTDKLVEEAAIKQNGDEILALFFERNGEDIPITHKAVTAAAGNLYSGSEIFALFFARKGIDYMTGLITTDVLTKAAHNRKILENLLSQRMEISIQTEVLKAAVGNFYDATEIEPLLNQPGFNACITAEVVQATASNDYGGLGIMKLLLDRYGINMPITEEVLKAAACNSFAGADIMALLLARQGISSLITKEVLQEAAKNTSSSSGKDVMALLFGHGGKEMADEGVLKTAAISPGGGNILAFILEETGDDIPISEDIMKAIVGDISAPAKVRLLLQHRERDVPITKEIVQVALENNYCAYELLTLFLRQWGKDVPITETAVQAAAANYSRVKLLKLIFDHRGHDVIVTEEAVVAAVGNGSRAKDVMAVLLDERGDDLPITANVLKAAVQNTEAGLDVLRLIFDERGDNIQVSEEVLKAAAGCPNRNITTYLQQHWQVDNLAL